MVLREVLALPEASTRPTKELTVKMIRLDSQIGELKESMVVVDEA